MSAAQAEREARARTRACFEGNLTHVKVGTWSRLQLDDAVTFVGHLADLHGTVCTCCPGSEKYTGR